MPYDAEISRSNPSCFIFMIDQSGSMADQFANSESNSRTKAEGVADSINRLLHNLVLKCSKGEGVRDYYDVGVLGFGAELGSAIAGKLSNSDINPISMIGDNPLRIEERMKRLDDGAGGIIEQKTKFPVWVDQKSNGGTPMCEAFAAVKWILKDWIDEHPDCFPPIVINITDGESTDGDPSSNASEIRSLTSSNGNVLLFNVHLSSSNGSKIEFPDTPAILPDNYAKLLFNMSSLLPTHINRAASQEGYNISNQSRGFVFNADLVSVIRFLDIGTRPGNLR